jgi:DNA-binding MarR family transcriptional regulator
MGKEELSALVALLDGDCTPGELAFRIGSSVKATERSVKRLEKQGYATTVDPNILHLTDAGLQRALSMRR